VTTLLSKPGDLANVLCATVLFVAYLLFRFLLRSKYVVREAKSSERWSYLISSLTCWCVIWGTWSLIYGTRAFLPGTLPRWSENRVSQWLLQERGIELALSDANTLFLLAACLYLLRGRAAASISSWLLLGMTLFAWIPTSLTVVDVFLLGTRADQVAIPPALAMAYSAMVSMAAFLALGWIHRRRFGDKSVLGILFLYAVCQPIAHLVFLNNTQSDWVRIHLRGPVTVPDDVKKFLQVTSEEDDTYAYVKRRWAPAHRTDGREESSAQGGQPRLSYEYIDWGSIDKILTVVEPKLPRWSRPWLILRIWPAQILSLLLAVLKAIMGWRVLRSYRIQPSASDLWPLDAESLAKHEEVAISKFLLPAVHVWAWTLLSVPILLVGWAVSWKWELILAFVGVLALLRTIGKRLMR